MTPSWNCELEARSGRQRFLWKREHGPLLEKKVEGARWLAAVTSGGVGTPLSGRKGGAWHAPAWS